jgi:putative CocE/NonD family hydrolase
LFRRFVLCGLALSLLLIPATGKAAPWSARGPSYPGVAVERDVPVRMSDGVTLFVNVIHPADASGNVVPGRFPVLVTQTPYNKLGTGTNFETDYLVQRGYVQVIADVRGTGSSEGQWTSFSRREQRVGYELVAWAASSKRPWSNGNIGLHGTSYGAINQFLTAAQHPPGLRAMFPIVPMSDAYRDVAITGGQLDATFMPFWLGLVTATSLEPPTPTLSDPAEGAKILTDHVQGAAAFQAAVTAGAATGGDQVYDGPFYRERSPIEIVDRVNVPTFVVGGWYDLFQRGEPMLYQHLARNGVPSRLLMGPWYHVSPSLNSGLPADGVPDLNALELRWFDHYVRGVADSGLDRDIAPVTYYRLGFGHYERASSWPPKSVGYQPRFIGGNGMSGGVLARSPSQTGSDTVPWVPISGLCSRSVAQWTALGADQGCGTNQSGNDHAGVYYDMPAGKGVRLAGASAAHLYLMTNGRDAPLTVRLEDVAPDGAATQISAGWNLLSLRALDLSKTVKRSGWIVQPFHPFTQKSVLPTPANKVLELWVEIFPTAAFIAPGHVLRLAIQQTDTPHQGPSAPELAASAGAMLTLLHDAKHPSAVVLPLQ